MKKSDKCFCIIFLMSIGSLFIIPPLEDEDDMQARRYKPLAITSTKLPFNTYLWWEHATYGITMVDSTNQAVLLQSTKARLLVDGSDWTTIDLSDNTNSYKIQAGWLDGNDLWLVMCDNPGTDFEVCFIEFDDSNDCNPIAVSPAMDNVYAMDIFKLGANIYVCNYEERGGPGLGENIVIWDVDSNPFVEKDTDTLGINGYVSNGYGVVVGANYYIPFTIDHDVFGTQTNFYTYDSVGTSITVSNNDVPGYRINTTIPNLKGMSYDGNDIFQFILEKVADGLNYLYEFSITADDLTEFAVHNVALQLDRNNAGTVPNELEKGFGISDEIVYEIKARRGGIIQLQNISAITDANIIAITDNFLMNDDGDMFEFTDVTDEMFKLSYTGGCFPLIKRGTFHTVRYYEANWNEKDSIKIYDDNGLLEVWAKITKKYFDSAGQIHYDFDFYSNEIARTTYEKTYSNDKTSEKLIDIIDNKMDFSYQSSSIVATTIQFDYVLKREAMHMFSTARWLENELLYPEPDAKIWSRAAASLNKNALIYPGTYNFKDDDDGGNPAGWVLSETGGTVNVIAALDGHRKVVEMDDTSGVAGIYMYNVFTDGAQTDGTIEFWVEGDDVTDEFQVQVREADFTVSIRLKVETDKIQYFYAAGWHDATGGGISDNTEYYFKIIFDCAADTYDFYLNGDLLDADIPFENVGDNVSQLWFVTANADNNYKYYVDAIGYSWDPAYTVGDNLVAWSLYNGHQDVRLVDIPNLARAVGGYFKGSLGVTRSTIRYRDNATSTMPVAATREPIERLTGIIESTEYRDAKIEDSTEAEQLATNRYTIGSADIQYIGLRVEGEGFLQEGQTVEVEGTQSITITKGDYPILRYKRWPKQDVTFMVLSDNIIFPHEFTSFLDTTRTQIHAANLQAFENQSDIIAHLTPEGGIALRLTNETGAASIKGTLVEADATVDNAFDIADADSVECFGAVYEDGVADGDECLVCIGGRVQVLLKDATASTRRNWVKVSDVAGRADATGASPAAAPTHFKEIGHGIESKGADTDVLAFIMMHFL